MFNRTSKLQLGESVSENWLLKEVYVLLNYLCINKDWAQHYLLGTTIELVHTVQYMLFDMPHLGDL